MTDAREIIARQIPGTSAEVCFGVADSIIERLDAAGYRILGPDEVDPVTVERAAEAGKKAAKAGDCHHVATAIRALGRKA